MRRSVRNSLSVLCLLGIALGGWTWLTSSDAVADPPTSCCDPALEPGVGGNPFCFEGHSCCASGQWACNNADATPSCPPGEVCPAGCAQKNEACDADEDCCSGNCKRNGRCK